MTFDIEGYPEFIILILSQAVSSAVISPVSFVLPLITALSAKSAGALDNNPNAGPIYIPCRGDKIVFLSTEVWLNCRLPSLLVSKPIM